MIACEDCGRPVYSDSVLRKLCVHCAQARRRNRERQRYQVALAQGLCVKCGAPAEHYVHCDRCHAEVTGYKVSDRNASIFALPRAVERAGDIEAKFAAARQAIAQQRRAGDPRWTIGDGWIQKPDAGAWRALHGADDEVCVNERIGRARPRKARAACA